MIVVLIVLGVLGVGIGGILFYRNNQKSIEKTVSNVETVAKDVSATVDAVKKV